MRPAQIAASALFAVVALASVSTSFASEVDPEADAAPVASTTRGLFSSWFGPKVDKPESAAVGHDAEGDVSPPVAVLRRPRANELVVDALGLLGIAYRLGGNTPSSGFDCSGLVRYVFQTAIGRELPRRAEEISRVGTKVDRSELRPGDLVFYKTLRKTFSHVGIYLGDNRFIHAPSTGGSVRVDDMTERYWTARFNGARRIGP